jgi:hypothetical protein
MQTKQTSSHEAVRHSEKKLKNLTFYRNHDLFISWVKTLKEMKANFTIRHSKYTTSITLQDGSKITFILNRYDNRVFIANKMVINDLKDNPKYYQIIKNQHSTKNFGMMNGINPCNYNEVINIDISSAYATTMYATGLIKENTFKMLQRLGKHERLPAMGMLAKRSLLFNYKDGKIDDTDLEVGDNRQVFFYLIKKGIKNITNYIINLRRVDPIERTILYTFLVFDGPLNVTLRIKCICFVLSSTQQNNRERSKIKISQKFGGVAFIFDAFIMYTRTNRKGHLFSPVGFHNRWFRCSVFIGRGTFP